MLDELSQSFSRNPQLEILGGQRSTGGARGSLSIRVRLPDSYSSGCQSRAPPPRSSL